MTRKANDEASLVFLFLLFDTKNTNKLVFTKIARIGFLLSEMTDTRTLLRKKKDFSDFRVLNCHCWSECFSLCFSLKQVENNFRQLYFAGDTISVF